MNNVEQTLSIIKPDAVERNLTEEIKSIFIKNNFTIRDIKKIHITKDEASEGKNAVVLNRKLMGATNPKDAKDNTIRKLYGISIDKNSVHGSDSIQNAKKEINFFFKD